MNDLVKKYPVFNAEHKTATLIFMVMLIRSYCAKMIRQGLSAELGFVRTRKTSTKLIPTLFTIGKKVYGATEKKDSIVLINMNFHDMPEMFNVKHHGDVPKAYIRKVANDYGYMARYSGKEHRWYMVKSLQPCIIK